MASISSSTSTAFDVTTLVSQLMAVERRPIDALNTKVSSTQSKISSWGTLTSLVSSFQSATRNLNTSLQKLTATPSDANAFSSAADSSAVPGSYSVNVSQLAQSQSLVAAGQASSTAAIGSGTPTTVTFEFGTISGGTLVNGIYSGASFAPAGGSASIVVDSSNNTLAGIRDAINAANLGVSATLVNDGSGTPYRLALTSTSSGAASSLRITTSGGDAAIDSLLAYDPAGTQNLAQTRAAQNASLTVNGIPIASTSNTLNGAIQGVSLNLKNITAAPASLAVARDTAAITAAAAGFVDAYNAMASQIKSRVAYGTNGAAAGALAGDNTLRQMQDQLRDIFLTPATGGSFTSLAQVGITSRSDGSLQLDSARLNSAIASNYSDVVNLFSAPSGYATRLDAWAKSALEPGGLIDARTRSLKQYIDDRTREIDKLELRMDALKKKYTTEYTNLNLILGRMNTTSTFLTQQLTRQNNQN